MKSYTRRELPANEMPPNRASAMRKRKHHRDDSSRLPPPTQTTQPSRYAKQLRPPPHRYNEAVTDSARREAPWRSQPSRGWMGRLRYGHCALGSPPAMARKHILTSSPFDRLPAPEGRCPIRPCPEPTGSSRRSRQRCHLQHFPTHAQPDPLLGCTNGHCIPAYGVGY
jgi:hypothetical protein